MATSGHGVWIACQQSAKVSLFHAMSHQLLTQVNVAQVVAQKLQSMYTCASARARMHVCTCLIHLVKDICSKENTLADQTHSSRPGSTFNPDLLSQTVTA